MNDSDYLNLLLAAIDNWDNFSRPEAHANQPADWLDGWDAAVETLTKNQTIICDWFRGLAATQQADLAALLADQVLHLRLGDDDCVHMIFPSPYTFDEESNYAAEIFSDDLPAVASMWRRYQRHGVIAWVAARDDIEPVESARSAQYRAARAALSELGINPSRP